MNPFENVSESPSRVVVFVADDSGVHGWEVFDGSASYRITGYPGGSAHARLTVEGEFHRIRKDDDSMRLEALMNQRRLGEGR